MCLMRFFWADDDWMIAIELINWEYFNSRISVVGKVILFLALFPWENPIVFGVFSCYYVINNEILMIRIFNIQSIVLQDSRFLACNWFFSGFS